MSENVFEMNVKLIRQTVSWSREINCGPSTSCIYNTSLSIPPSVHPAIVLHFSVTLSRRQQVQEGTSVIPLLFHILHGILRDPTGVPGHWVETVPPASSWFSLGSPPCGMCPENLQIEAPRERPDQMS